MAATVTLATTTLAEGVDERSGRFKLASTASVVAGMRLFLDGELVTVLRLEVDPWVSVKRGVDGTPSLQHSGGVTVYIGRADQFFSQPPVGRPSAAILVSPYIDVIGGGIYFAQGDAVPGGSAVRWWQLQTATPAVGSLGVRTTTFDPTTST